MTICGKKRTAALQLHFVQLDDGLQRRVVRDVGHDRLRMRAERLLESLYRVEKEMRLRNEERLRAGLHAGEALVDLGALARAAELLHHHRDVLGGVVGHVELLARGVLVEHAHLDHACPPQRFAATASLAPSVTKIAPVRRCISETTPARRPSLTLRAVTYSMSGPGVRLSASAAAMKSASVSAAGIYCTSLGTYWRLRTSRSCRISSSTCAGSSFSVVSLANSRALAAAKWYSAPAVSRTRKRVSTSRRRSVT